MFFDVVELRTILAKIKVSKCLQNKHHDQDPPNGGVSASLMGDPMSAFVLWRPLPKMQQTTSGTSARRPRPPDYLPFVRAKWD